MVDPEFARFARIAKSSEQEVLNHLYRARNRNYITPAEFEDAAWAARKALKAVNGLIRYLDDTTGFGKNNAVDAAHPVHPCTFAPCAPSHPVHLVHCMHCTHLIPGAP